MSRSGHLRTMAAAVWSRGSWGCREGDPVPLKGPQGRHAVTHYKAQVQGSQLELARDHPPVNLVLGVRDGGAPWVKAVLNSKAANKQTNKGVFSVVSHTSLRRLERVGCAPLPGVQTAPRTTLAPGPSPAEAQVPGQPE